MIKRISKGEVGEGGGKGGYRLIKSIAEDKVGDAGWEVGDGFVELMPKADFG